MKKLEVRFTRTPGEWKHVGVLAEDRGRVYFQYDDDFLATGLNLSPFRLPFKPVLFEHRDREFGPLPGLFDDSLPDGWGLLLMDRHFRSLGLNVSEIGPLDRLAWLGTRTMGALTYHPPAVGDGVDGGQFDLHDLARQSQEILTGAAVDVLPQLLKAGGSPGGARPKVLVGYNPNTGELISGEDDLPEGFEHWIVKFIAKDDSPDVGGVEYAYSIMARECGIDMPPTRLFETAKGDRFFGAKRFDRGSTGSPQAGSTGSPQWNNRRCHVHTFGNIIQSNFRIPSADYADLLKATGVLTRNHQDVLQAFRRMVFNVLAHNRDDHVKNFAFILNDAAGSAGSPQGGEWSLAPAYDLLFTSGPGGEHTMTIAGEGQNPGRSHMLRLARQADIPKRQAGAVIEAVQAAISRWPEFAANAGLSKQGIGQITQSLPRLQ